MATITYMVTKDYIKNCVPTEVIPERMNIRPLTTAEALVNYVIPSHEAQEGHYIEHSLHYSPIPASTLWKTCKFQYNMHYLLGTC